MITMHVTTGTERVIISGLNGNGSLIAQELCSCELKKKVANQFIGNPRGVSQEELKICLLKALLGDDIEIFIH